MYFLYLCAIANQTAAVQTCFLRGGFAGGCSRPHVLPFHSLPVGLTLPFNEGPHFPCFRSREMESPRRCCDGMGAWGGSAVANPLSPRLAPSRPGAVLVKLTPGPTAAPTQIPVCTSKQEGDCRLVTMYLYTEALDRTRERSSPRYSVQHRCRRSNPTPTARTNPLWILLGLAFPLAQSPK